MRIVAVMLFALLSGCCAERAQTTNDYWTGYSVLVPVDVNSLRWPQASSSLVAAMCREYIDQCWERNIDLHLSNRDKPVVICKVPDDMELQPRNARPDSLQERLIPCDGVSDSRLTRLCDAIANVCDNYGLTCSFENNSVTIELPNGTQGKIIGK